MQASHIPIPGFFSQLLIQFPADADPARQQRWLKHLGPVTHMGDWMKFLAPAFSLVKPWLTAAIWRIKEQTEDSLDFFPLKVV